jgi:hypothetical protein
MSDEMIHGLTPQQVAELHERMSKLDPAIVNSCDVSYRFRSLFESELPEGASWDVRRTAQSLNVNNTGGNASNTLITQQTPYQPEFASPDRQQYPVHRILANRYWRLFFKLDPVIGNAIDLYSELPWSNFELTGEGVEGEVRHTYERMVSETQILAMLPYFVREFLVVGEVIPHLFFDDSKGIFTYISLHNPDQIQIIDTPFIKMDPVVQFIPDDKLRAVLLSDDPQLVKIRNKMPPELLSKLYSKQSIVLSPINCTFIPRKLHPYDTRGTSIISRMWRVLMLEDAIFNATIQTARRHAAPLKVAKLGNAATGFIPPPEQEKKLLELLAQAEQDPNAWLVYHYGIQFETIGTTDRSLSIGREWDILERIKLVALGISKSFLHGEVTYASAATGLQVFLQRLKSLRMFFEQKFLYPKFFRIVAEINGWIRPKPSEITHRFRVKRSQRELIEDNAYIVPKIVWDKTLDPQINDSLISAMSALESLGVKFSKTSKMAAVGYSFEEETKKIHREMEFEKQFLPTTNQQQGKGGGGAPMVGGGGGGMPPPPTGGGMGEGGADIGDTGEGQSIGEPAGGAPGTGEAGSEPPPAIPGASKRSMRSGAKKRDGAPGRSSIESLTSNIWVDDKYGNWDAEEVASLKDLITEGKTDSAFWQQLGMTRSFKKAVSSGDTNMMWDLIEDYLVDHGYPDVDIDDLRTILEKESVLRAPMEFNALKSLEDRINENMSDKEFMDVVKNIAAEIKNPGPVNTDNILTGIG